MASALIIEDDCATAQLIADHLQQAGHRVELARSGDAGLRAALSERPALVVLDWMLPNLSGPEVCRGIRQSAGLQPIVVMLTARVDESDVLEGFAAGIDDYVRKPFGVRELMCRLSALLRLVQREPPAALLSCGALSVDLAARLARVGEQELPLTPKELDLLVHLMQHEGVLQRREELLESVWGYRHAGYARTVDSHITRLRRKLVLAGLTRELISTVHRVGYRFDASRGRS